MRGDTDRDLETNGESEAGPGKEWGRSGIEATLEKEIRGGIEMVRGMVFAIGGTERGVEVGTDIDRGEVGVWSSTMDMSGS